MAGRTLTAQELESRFGKRNVVTANAHTFLVRTREAEDGEVRVCIRPHPKHVCREAPFGGATWPLVRQLEEAHVTETVNQVGLSGFVKALVEEHLSRAQIEPEPEPFEADLTTLPDEALLAEVHRRGLWPVGADAGGQQDQPEGE